MKSKVRNITVGDSSYVWGVTETDWHTVNIKIWKKGYRGNPWLEVLKKFDDPWINFSELARGELASTEESSTPVTPKIIAACIKEVVSLGWVSNSGPIVAKINTDGGLMRANT